jgi:putative ABC transport system ATP-binding protein
MTGGGEHGEVAPAVPAVALRGVGKTYRAGKNAFVALSSIDLDIAPGAVTALMGPSGSGKTTLLSIIGCILRPTTGAVVIDGRDVARLGEAERSAVRLARIGFVFQGYNLFPTLTARQNVALVLELKRVRRRDMRRRAEELLDAVDLADKAESYPADLSGGQKQRVAIARALAGDPSLLLADEPTAALDLQTGRRIMGLFRKLARDMRRAVVVVTHDSRILDLADRVVALDDGRISRDAALPALPGAAAPLTATMLRRPRSFDADTLPLVMS